MLFPARVNRPAFPLIQNSIPGAAYLPPSADWACGSVIGLYPDMARCTDPVEPGKLKSAFSDDPSSHLYEASVAWDMVVSAIKTIIASNVFIRTSSFIPSVVTMVKRLPSATRRSAADAIVGGSHPYTMLATAAAMLVGEANTFIDLHNRLFDQLRGCFLVAALVRGRLTQ